MRSKLVLKTYVTEKNLSMKNKEKLLSPGQYPQVDAS